MLPPLPSSSFSMSSSRCCFNHLCSEFKLDHYLPGWRLRSGGVAHLCDRCASAYEQGKFCDVFHQMDSGWRCCESCGKRIHCGCIVSASAFMMLDVGGVECLACARKKIALGPKFSPPPSFLFNSPISEKFKDLSISWCSSMGANKISYQPPSLLDPSVLQFDLPSRGDRYEFSQPTSKDRGLNDLMGKLTSENSKNGTSYILNNQNAGPNCKVSSTCGNVNVYHPLVSSKEGPCQAQLAKPVSVTTPIETNGLTSLDGRNLRHVPNCSPLSHLHIDLNGGTDSPFESKIQNLRTHLDTPGKYQVVPRYWPKVSYQNQVLQNASKESESVVTPLFEKMLSASDTGKVGRLVLPKKCAEAFFPQISHSEGVPLKIQDPMGKEWTFQFRFWPNNTSRMYVLEGVTTCMQNLHLQAGDTVIFSRLDPERKLIMDFRKASVAQSSDQETGSRNNNRDSCTNGDAEPIDTHSRSKVKKTIYVAKETPGIDLSSEKKKSRMMITRSKRQKVEKGDDNELKLTLEEAQRFILPPPNFTATIVVIEEYEFEEYEDAPIIGTPTGVRQSSSADRELVVEEHDKEAMTEFEGHSKSPKATTKHPRHKTGCSCVVCIQSPSGKSPKHDKCCSCNICDMLKRRKRSLLLRREKKQIEKEVSAHKELEPLNSGEELHKSAEDSGSNSRNHEHHASSPLISKIDLNFQPEKDEESLHHDDTLKSSFKPPSSSSDHNQIDKEDEGKHTEVADTTTSTSM